MNHQTFEHINTSHMVVTPLPVRQWAKTRKYCGSYVREAFASDEVMSCYHESNFEPSLRAIPCHEISGGFGPIIKHTGWYYDGFHDETIYGLVYRLPSGRGFLAGATLGKNMATVIERHVITDEIEAASTADRIAELWAEKERELAEEFEDEN